jgi:signal transduction histidine kinase
MPSVDDMTTTTAPTSASAEPGARRSMLRQLAADSGYVLLSFPIAVASFVVLITGLAAGVGLGITLIGLPILAGALYAARGFADMERLRMPAVLRQDRVRPYYRAADPGASVWRRVVTPIIDSQSWLDLAHGLVKFPVATFSFVITVVWWAGAIGGCLYWSYAWAIPNGPEDQDLADLLGLGDSIGARIGMYTAFGLFFLITLPVVVRGCALLEASFGKVLLTGVAEMRNRITVLEDQKRAAVSAEATALRRLERDIHDGPQQRLVRLGMDLARAQRQLDRDPDAARGTLGEAAGLARETLEELRALSRGIAPPVLADRGLAAALAAVAARSPVPVELAVDLERERLTPVAENTAYFVVSEALANIAKHSDATTCRVDVRCSAERLRVVVEDDGTGGAVLAPGHGLAGLADRLQAVDGVLTVDSPRGGPTRLTAELPCG